MFPLVVLFYAALLNSCAPSASSSPQPAEPATGVPLANEAPAATEAPAVSEVEATLLPQPTQSLHTQGTPETVQPEPIERTEAPSPGEQPFPIPTTFPTPSPDTASGLSTQSQWTQEPGTGLMATEAGRESPLAPTTLPTYDPQNLAPAQTVHQVHVEWPTEMRLGDSDTVALTLIPSDLGFMVVAEYPEHGTITQTVVVQRLTGYELLAIARLDGPGFELAPQGEQVQYLSENIPISWRWALTPHRGGQQRLALTLGLRWMPPDGAIGLIRESTIYSKSLDVRVHALLGLSRVEALRFGILSLLFGCVLGMVSLAARPQRKPSRFHHKDPNIGLVIETSQEIQLTLEVGLLLQTLFQRYARVIIEQEFLSGYSGARTLLALPVRDDGRADAYTIAKIGERSAIEREYENYEVYVKDTLPPITARIQHPPVITRRSETQGLAALQYTFIGEPGKAPVSLRRALLAEPDADLLRRMMDTFGPNWWLQRRPYVFHAAVEYDRLLPSHLVIAPDRGRAAQLDGRTLSSKLKLQIGDRVQLRRFAAFEPRQDRLSLSLQGFSAPGEPPLRVRWLSTDPPEGRVGKVVATRETLLAQSTVGCSLYGLPDPLPLLPDLLREIVSGCQSIIHGDLNLENLLIGPGRLIWLIDFAATRNGHTLMDFSHLIAEIIAHILAPQIASAEDYITLLSEPSESSYSRLFKLIQTVEEYAGFCYFNPSDSAEFDLSLILTCLGALKHSNLEAHARHFLLLTAAHRLAQRAQSPLAAGKKA